MRDILNGVAHLHSLGIAHRDLKLDNIMMSSSNDDAFPIIIDFGLSKIFHKNEISIERLGTLAFISPEIVTN